MSENAADELSLAGEFPAATREQWLNLVSGVLKGAPFEKRLVAHTYDGIAIAPLYAGDASARPVQARAAGARWQVVQRVDHPDPAAANAQALHDLENGATALTLVFAKAVGSYGFGLEPSGAAVTRVLEGVHLDAGISLDLDSGADALRAADAFSGLVEQHGVAPRAVSIRFGIDPLGAAAIGGAAPPPDDLLARMADAVRRLADRGFTGPFAVADSRVIHNAGGSEAQELAYALAAALAYARSLEAGGIRLGDAVRMIYFRLAADADQFLTMAKFRALRKLWASVQASCGLAVEPAFVAAETAWRMMTRQDPYVNTLRTTMSVVAAGLGGADSIVALPHTAAVGLPDRFARRIARNTQLILMEESSLAKVADPAAGAGAIESLTRELCDAAWSLFQDIERVGGLAKALASGLVQDKVAAVRSEREQAIARRRDVLTGTSEFPDIAETPPAVLAPFPHNGEAHQSGGGLPSTLPAGFKPLPSSRLAEPFEALREASDRFLVRTGARPRIFLANLGRLADFTARATFAKNFFEAGGIAALTSDGFPNPDAMASAFREAHVDLACICGSDDTYASGALDAAKALGAAGAKLICLAGRPGELETALRAAGVGTFIFVGCDVPATLRSIHAAAGIA